MAVSVPHLDVLGDQEPHVRRLGVLEGQEAHVEGQEAHVGCPSVPTTTAGASTTGTATVTVISSDKTAGLSDSAEATHVQPPERPLKVSEPSPVAVCATLEIFLDGTPQAAPNSPTSPPHHHIRPHLSFAETRILALIICLIAPAPVLAAHRAPAAILHIAAGTSLVASVTIPPLRGSSNVPASWWIAMFATWSIAFAIFLVLELCRLPDWAQRRLLVGLFIFSGLNLTATLAESEDSMLEGWLSWSPLAMTTSLVLVQMLMKFSGVGASTNLVGV